MKRRLILAVTLALILGPLSCAAFAQAAAEAALANSISGTAANKAGSSLNKSLSKALDTTGQKLSSATSTSSPGPQTYTVPKDTARTRTSAPTASPNGKFDLSVQGSNTCEKSEESDDKSTVQAAHPNDCAKQPSHDTRKRDPKYASVVNLGSN